MQRWTGRRVVAGVAALAAFGVPGIIATSPRAGAAGAAGVASTPSPGTVTTFAGSNDDGLLATDTVVRAVKVVADGAGGAYFTDSSLVRHIGADGKIATVAGNGLNYYRGDGGPATMAELTNPYGVARDGAGNVYVGESDGRVRRISPAGVITAYAGNGDVGYGGDGGPAVDGRLYEVKDLATDAAGDLFIADPDTYRVRKVSPGGIITTVLGNGVIGSTDDGHAGTSGPVSTFAIAADLAGDVYFYDMGQARIRKLGLDGLLTTVAGGGGYGTGGDGGPALQAQLGTVSALAADSHGNLYLAESDNNRVRKIDAAGIITTVAGTGVQGSGGDGGPALAAQLLMPRGVSADSLGNVFITDWSERLRKVDPSGAITTIGGGGTYGFRGDGGPATKAQLNLPSAMVADGAGNVYIADQGNSRVRKVDAAGTITTFAGGGTPGGAGDGGPAASAGLIAPSALALDAQGNLYIGDSGTSTVRRVTPAGIITTVAGSTGPGDDLGDGGPASSAHFAGISGLAVDSGGNLYVSDYFNQRVRKVSAAGIVTTVAGNGYQGQPVDNGPATQSPFQFPEGIAVDRHGNLYVADVGNDRIRKVSPNGIITSVAGDAEEDFRIPHSDTPPPFDGHLAGSVGLGAGINSVAVDAEGNIYFPEAWGADVRKVSAAGRLSTVAGSGAEGFAGDGGPATAAQMFSPVAVALDPAGNLYVAEDGVSVVGNRVRKVWGVGAIAAPVGAVKGWGWNVLGQLGDGTTTDRLAPVAAIGAPVVRAVATGAYHTVAVLDDGSVRAWGSNALGQVGDGTATDRLAPVAVAGLSDVTMVSAGAYHTLAVRGDGTVWAWGWNGVGQLGDGTTTDRHAPVQVRGLVNVVAVAAGTYHSLALRSDGTVWAWGWNGGGQLGPDRPVVASTPEPVAGLTGAVAIAGGLAHSLAVRYDGTVWAWGWNAGGQLGDSTTIDRPAPWPVSGLANVAGVAAGAVHSLAVRADGTVWAWGWNGVGQLGVGNTTDHHLPVLVAGVSGAGAVAAGFNDSLALGRDGRVSAWGWGAFGQLGTGAAADAWAPAKVGGAAGVVALAAGVGQGFAIAR